MYTIGPLTEINIVHHRTINEINMVFFLRNKRFNGIIFISHYKLRYWRLQAEERTCQKTHLGGCDYQLSTCAPPLEQLKGKKLQ